MISREDAERELAEYEGTDDGEYGFLEGVVYATIFIGSCGECKYSHTTTIGGMLGCGKHRIMKNPTGYCDDFERKTDDKDM